MLRSLNSAIDVQALRAPSGCGPLVCMSRIRERVKCGLERTYHGRIVKFGSWMGSIALITSRKRFKPCGAKRNVPASSMSSTLANARFSRFRCACDFTFGSSRSLVSMMTAEIPRKPVMVISGASYGVGAAIARRFVGTFQVCALARGRDKLYNLVEECRDLGDIAPYVCDVSSKDDVMSTCKAILERYARVDVLINNASVYQCQKLQDMSLEQIDQMIDVNLKGTMYMTHCILPSMIEAKSGKIIMVNSVAGTPSWTIPGETAYCASKHGQTGFASALANEVREHGITVTSLHPGGIDTPLQVAAGTPEDVRAQFLSTDDLVETIEYVVNLDSRVLVKSINLWRTTFWH